MRGTVRGRFMRGGVRGGVRFSRPFSANGWGPRPPPPPPGPPCGPMGPYRPCPPPPPFMRMGPPHMGRYSSPAFPNGVPMRRPPPPPPPPPPHHPPMFGPLRPPPPPPIPPHLAGQGEPEFIRLIPSSFPGRGRGMKRPNTKVIIQDDIESSDCEPLVNATDEELQVLSELFQPLYCQLCQMHLNSPQQAASHYIGKNHKRNIGTFLIKRRGNQPMIQPIPEQDSEIHDESYCSLCDVVLTSPAQAHDHYSGRNHNMKLNGRMAMTKRVFKTRPGQPLKRGKAGQGQGPPPKKPKHQPTVCAVCNVQITSEHQMQLHESGQKHKTNLAKMIASGVNPYATQTVAPVTQQVTAAIVDYSADDCNTAITNETWFDPALVNNNSRVVSFDDLSLFRTPSGTYYCPSCDATVNSETQFSQHLESKRHKKQETTPTSK